MNQMHAQLRFVKKFAYSQKALESRFEGVRASYSRK